MSKDELPVNLDVTFEEFITREVPFYFENRFVGPEDLDERIERENLIRANLEREPDNPFLRLQLGNLLLIRGETEAARTEWQAVRRLCSEQKEMLDTLAQAASRMLDEHSDS